jgi:hypothetical protein
MRYTTQTFLFEQFAAKRLRLQWEGLSTMESRRADILAALMRRGLADSVAGRRSGTDQTWRELWQRVYGEPIPSGDWAVAVAL